MANDLRHFTVSDRGDAGGLVQSIVAEPADLAQPYGGGLGGGGAVGVDEVLLGQGQARGVAVGDRDDALGEGLDRPGVISAASIGLLRDAVVAPERGEERR